MTVSHKKTVDCPESSSSLIIGVGATFTDGSDEWCVHDDYRLVPDWDVDEDGVPTPPDADWKLGTDGLTAASE